MLFKIMLCFIVQVFWFENLRKYYSEPQRVKGRCATLGICLIAGFILVQLKRKECYIKVSVFVYFQIIRATLSGHPKMISLSALSYVCPSVCPSVCPFKISCPDHIFSTLGPIWLILRPQSAFGQKVCVDLEPIFKVTFEDHSRII